MKTTEQNVEKQNVEIRWIGNYRIKKLINFIEEFNKEVYPFSLQEYITDILAIRDNTADLDESATIKFREIYDNDETNRNKAIIAHNEIIDEINKNNVTIINNFIEKYKCTLLDEYLNN
jgi:protein associated with RNAse G/E